MDLKELLTKAAEIGGMPKVRVNKSVRHSEFTQLTEGTEGTVTQIRPTGIAVRFPGMAYDSWFWFEKQDDKLSRYTDCLELCGE